jgi:molybdopterin synthase sulfur carrier subunit
MSIVVRVPASLSHLTGGNMTVECAAGNVDECIKNLEDRFPGIKNMLHDEQGNQPGFINIFVNGENIKYLQGMETTLQEGDEITMIPAIAGG